MRDEALDGGITLEELWARKGASGFTLDVAPGTEGKLLISFCFQTGPEAGDGGQLEVESGRGFVEAPRSPPGTVDMPLLEEPYRTALTMAEFLAGFPRYPKMHPCGVVLSRQPLQEVTPCFTSRKNYPTTHYDMEAVEGIGLVKMDILAQGGLAVMRYACASLTARGIPTDLEAMEPWEDPAVWEMIAGVTPGPSITLNPPPW